MSAIFGWAQAPGKFNYQAIARDANGIQLTDQGISVRISVLQGSSSGTAVFSEEHSPTTNTFGLFNLQIGTGTSQTGSLSGIAWGNDSYFIEVEMDPEGGSNYSVLSNSELVSVPYALYAESVANDSVMDDDSDPANEMQTLSLVGDSLVLSDGGSVDMSVYDQSAEVADNAADIAQNASDIAAHNAADLDIDSTNELITNMAFSNDSLLLTEGGIDHGVDLSGLIDDNDWLVDGDTVYNDSKWVGIGTASPGAPFNVKGGNAWPNFGSGSVIVGDVDSGHLAMDSNDIIAKVNADSAGRLWLQRRGQLSVGNWYAAGYKMIVASDSNDPGQGLGGIMNYRNNTHGNNGAVGIYSLDYYNHAAVAYASASELYYPDGEAYGSYHTVLANGAGNAYGNYNDVESSADTAFGTYNDIDAAGTVGVGTYTKMRNGGGVNYGAYTSVQSPSSVAYGAYNRIMYGNSSTYGTYNYLYDPSGTGFGTYNQVYNPSGSSYGMYNYAYSPSSNAYGAYNLATSSNYSYGAYNRSSYPVYSGYGSYNQAYGNNAYTHYASYNFSYQGSTGGAMATYNQAQSYGSTSYGTRNDAYNYRSTGGTAYGSYNYAYTSTNYGTARGSYHYGYAGGSLYDYAYGLIATASGGYYGNYAIYASGVTYSSGGYSSSDAKLKSNIRDYEGGLNDLMQLQPRRYQFRSSDFPTMGLPEEEQIGLIAQELEEVFPELIKMAKNPAPTMPLSHAVEQGLTYEIVSEAEVDEEGKETKEAMVVAGDEVEFKAVRYESLIPVLIKAVQEQQELIEALEDRIQQLEND